MGKPLRRVVMLLVLAAAVGLLWMRGWPGHVGIESVKQTAPRRVAREPGPGIGAPPPKFVVDGIAFLEQACDKHDLDACDQLGLRLWAGWDNTPVDARRALRLFIDGCQKNHAESCGNAGGLIYQGHKQSGLLRDHRAALVYLDKACAMGIGLACSRAQSIFELGLIPKDPVRAEHYHAKALALGVDDP